MPKPFRVFSSSGPWWRWDFTFKVDGEARERKVSVLSGPWLNRRAVGKMDRVARRAIRSRSLT